MRRAMLIATLLLGGCGWNPFDPTPLKEYSNFFEFVTDMDSPERVAKWLMERAEYSERDSTGMGDGGDDVERYARYIYDRKRGACMQQACLFAFANRWHGYEAGIVVIFPRPGSLMAPHAMSWFVGKSGRLSMTNNDHVSRDIYDGVRHMFDKFVEADNELVVYDGRLEKVLYSRFRGPDED